LQSLATRQPAQVPAGSTQIGVSGFPKQSAFEEQRVFVDASRA
jgi:hypothetical protein